MPDTNLTARVWPEDTGTGAADGNEDWDSAGYMGGMAAKDNASDYVEAGFGITPDYTTPAFDLAPGLAYIKYTGSVSIQLPTDDATTYSGTWDQGVTFAVDVDQQTGIALTDSAVNRIYLATDLTTNDGAYVRVDTEASPNAPTDPYIKIAEIDTTNDTTTELNREPSATFSDVSVTGQVDAASAEVVDLSITQGHGLLGLPNHHVNYASGLSNEEISRFTLASGDVLELWRLEASLKGGGTNSNVALEVYDLTNATSLGSVTAGSRAEGADTPLGTSGAGATIVVRLSTGSSAVDLCATGITSVSGN